ncbi:MAG: dinitrogenase iron-molybdenum cofactor biosynthesis protein [Candidatus Neomarinimicrobiota bacterium]|nr:MAG: dinitrogenase iron-molybdenum cofactor biosynthesis protein [Candidatus Neomarinimicrobiota bacterium]
MIVCIPSDKNSLDSKVSDVFARCNYFIFFNTENSNVEIVDNSYKDSQSGAGVQATQLVIQKKAKAVIAKSVGPNAERILFGSGIKIYKAVDGTVKDNIEKLIENKLEEVSH